MTLRSGLISTHASSSADDIKNSASSQADGDHDRRGYEIRSIHATGHPYSTPPANPAPPTLNQPTTHLMAGFPCVFRHYTLMHR
jgi:hypothetical protein